MGILFDSEDVSIFDLKVGDVIDIAFKKDINWPLMKRRVRAEEKNITGEMKVGKVDLFPASSSNSNNEKEDKK